MGSRFLKRWRRASRVARWAVFQQALPPVLSLALAAMFARSALVPYEQGRMAQLHGRTAGFDFVVHNPNPNVRSPFDLGPVLIFSALALSFAKDIGSLFVLDRWTPPIEEPDKDRSDGASGRAGL